MKSTLGTDAKHNHQQSKKELVRRPSNLDDSAGITEFARQSEEGGTSTPAGTVSNECQPSADDNESGTPPLDDSSESNGCRDDQSQHEVPDSVSSKKILYLFCGPPREGEAQEMAKGL